MNTHLDLPTLDKIFAEWLTKAMAHAKEVHGYSQNDIAQRTGINRTSLIKAMKGERAKDGRKLTAPEVAILAQETGYPLPSQLGVASGEIMKELIKVNMPVAQGIWRDRSKPVVTEHLLIQEFHQPAYEGITQYARLLDDNHADAYAPRGFYVICVDYRQARKTLNHGDLVVVERLKTVDGIALAELSVRRLVRADGRWILDSLSTVPGNVDPIVYEKDTDTLRICDLVIGAYRPPLPM